MGTQMKLSTGNQIHGKIMEIRAYYACPPGGPGRPYELGGFDYAGRGYPLAET